MKPKPTGQPTGKKGEFVPLQKKGPDIPPEILAKMKAAQPKPIVQDPPKAIQLDDEPRAQAGRTRFTRHIRSQAERPQASNIDELNTKIQSLGLYFNAETCTEYKAGEKVNGPDLIQGENYTVVLLKDRGNEIIPPKIIRNNAAYVGKTNDGNGFWFSRMNNPLGNYKGRDILFFKGQQGHHVSRSLPWQTSTIDFNSNNSPRVEAIRKGHSIEIPGWTTLDNDETDELNKLLKGKPVTINIGAVDCEATILEIHPLGIETNQGIFYFNDYNVITVKQKTNITSLPDLKPGDVIALNIPDAIRLITENIIEGEKCKLYLPGGAEIVTFQGIKEDPHFREDKFYFLNNDNKTCSLPIPFPVTIEFLDQEKLVTDQKELKLGNKITLSVRENPTGKLIRGKNYEVRENGKISFDKPHKLDDWFKMEDGVYCIQFETGEYSLSGSPYKFGIFIDRNDYSFREIIS